MSTIPACGQCGPTKPAILQVQGVPLCVDCYYKFESARALGFRMNASMMNFTMDQMDEISGFQTSGRIELPPTPKGPIIFNHINVDNSVVGAINTGIVKTIDVSLDYLHSAGNDKLGEALKTLTEAILQASLDDASKNELVEQVAFLSEQAVASAKDRKPGVIKATLSALGQAAGTISAIAGAWQVTEPILKSLFGFDQ